MKMKTKWLLPLPLLIAPIAGEMVLNKEGLPTPWPVILISGFISLASAIRFRSEKTSLSRSDYFLLAFNIFRSSASLMGSFNSLRVAGIERFQYPESALLVPLTLPFLMLTIKKGIKKLETANLDEEIPLQNINNTSIPELFAELVKEKEKKDNLRSLKKTYSLRYICWGLLIFSLGWSLTYLIATSGFKNFPVSAQFITNNCTSTKTPLLNLTNPDGTTYTKAPTFYIKRGRNETYFIGIVNSYDLSLRSFNIAIVFVFLFFPPLIDFVTKSTRSLFYDQALGILFFTVAIFNAFFVPALYILLGFMLQDNTMSFIEELKFCDINPTLFTSKTGYIIEWFNQEWTSLKQLSLT